MVLKHCQVWPQVKRQLFLERGRSQTQFSIFHFEPWTTLAMWPTVSNWISVSCWHSCVLTAYNTTCMCTSPQHSAETILPPLRKYTRKWLQKLHWMSAEESGLRPWTRLCTHIHTSIESIHTSKSLLNLKMSWPIINLGIPCSRIQRS